MAHWVDTYPHKVYVSVLLLDGKLFNYKIGQRYWESPYQITMRHSEFEMLDRMTTEHTHWEVANDEEHEKVFRELAREWLKQWEIHEDYYGSNYPYSI